MLQNKDLITDIGSLSKIEDDLIYHYFIYCIINELFLIFFKLLYFNVLFYIISLFKIC